MGPSELPRCWQRKFSMLLYSFSVDALVSMIDRVRFGIALIKLPPMLAPIDGCANGLSNLFFGGLIAQFDPEYFKDLWTISQSVLASLFTARKTCSKGRPIIVAETTMVKIPYFNAKVPATKKICKNLLIWKQPYGLFPPPHPTGIRRR